MDKAVLARRVRTTSVQTANPIYVPFFLKETETGQGTSTRKVVPVSDMDDGPSAFNGQKSS